MAWLFITFSNSFSSMFFCYTATNKHMTIFFLCEISNFVSAVALRTIRIKIDWTGLQIGANDNCFSLNSVFIMAIMGDKKW